MGLGSSEQQLDPLMMDIKSSMGGGEIWVSWPVSARSSRPPELAAVVARAELVSPREMKTK